MASNKKNITKDSLDGAISYEQLSDFAEARDRELTEMYSSVIELTDRYGKLICRVTNVLGKNKPKSIQDSVVRDLMADVFDFLREWRRPLFEGRLQVAYPLARRAYESLSLLGICAQDSSFAEKWEKGKKISNFDIRKALSIAPKPESEVALKDLYKFFSLGAHPNRDLISYRYLGEGNEFVLGSIGMPDLVFTTDHCMKLIQMWFWFAAVISYYYHDETHKADKQFIEDYMKTANDVKKVYDWLAENFNRLLEESLKELEQQRPQ